MKTNVSTNACPKCGAPIPADAPQGLCPKCVLAGAASASETVASATATGEIPSLPRVAAAFPQLEILELIGRGGMGFVFKARQPHLDRFVALKLLPDKLARDPHFAERFNREGRVLAKLNHPNIVSVFDFGQTADCYFLVMEFVDGVNLRQAMQAGRFSPVEALHIVPKICEALQYAHEQGVLHRDIKPENILLDAKGRVKIADFGIAKLVGEDAPPVTLTGTGAALGTPHYMAPEQLEKPGSVDHRADIYSLGVVFYEMLTGELPIGRFAPPSAKTPVDHSVDEVVFRALEKDRDKRYQSAGQVKTEVEHLAGTSLPPWEKGMGGDGPHGTIVIGVREPRWWRPVAVLFLVLGALGVPPTLAAIASAQFVLNLFTLLALTGVALLTRHRVWRGAALAANGLGLLLPWLSVFNVTVALQGGSLGLDWKPSAFGLPDSAGLTVLFAGLEMSAFAAGLLVLLRRDARALFAAPARPSKGRMPPVHAEAGYSFRAFAGAILVGLSLLKPLTVGVGLLAGKGSVTARDLWLALGSVALPGLAGTLVGWLALNEIRDGRGVVRGLPLALFATLTWPLLALVAVTLGPPWFLLVPGGDSGGTHLLGRFLVMLLPAGVLTFALWAVHATARWAMDQPPARQRGALKWVFAGLLTCGMGILLVSKPGEEHSEFKNVRLEPAASAVAQSSEIRVKLRVAKGSVATVQLVRRDTEPPAAVPFLVGYVVAPDDERGRCEFVLSPGPGLTPPTNPPSWTMSLAAEDGGTVRSISAELGPLTPVVTTGLKNALEIGPDTDTELLLTAESASANANDRAPRVPLTLRVRGYDRRAASRRPIDATAVGIGSTNWLDLVQTPAALTAFLATPEALAAAESNLQRAASNAAAARQLFNRGALPPLDLHAAEAAHTATRMVVQLVSEARAKPKPAPEAAQAARVSLTDNWKSACERLEQTRRKIRSGVLATNDPELAGAELQVALARAALDEDHLAAAEARLEGARKILRRLEELGAAKQATTQQVEQARRDEISAQAVLSALKALR